MRYVLNFYAGQDPGNETMLEFREDLVRVRYDLFSLRVDATDDGDIWIVETEERGKCRWMNLDSRRPSRPGAVN